MTDEEIDYSDIPPTSEEEFQRARLRMPESHGTVILKLDPDVLAWFQSKGESYQARINSVLRDYVMTHSD